MTTLTNPTNDDLNWAFALNVSKPVHPITGEAIKPDDHGIVAPPTYTESMDAVLPWVNQWTYNIRDNEYLGVEVQLYDKTSGRLVSVATMETMPRACVLALLVAHGVEVVYDAKA